MPSKDSRPVRVLVFGLLLGLFASCEFAVGLYVNSLALLTDSIHLLTDVAAMVVGYKAIQYAKLPADNTHTYGLVRYEILGGLANACFLLAVCLFIAIEAVQRFIAIGELRETELIIYTGCVGLALNGFGILLFRGHAHGHSHGGGGHGHAHQPIALLDEEEQDDEEEEEEHGHGHGHGGDEEHDHLHSHSHNDHGHGHGATSSVNMRAIFLHVLSDFLGSIGVITSGVLETYLTWPYRFYIDPAVSLLIAVVIAASAVPILRTTAAILLQSAPEEVSLALIKRKLLQIPTIRQLGNVHVWQLSEGTLIGSAQVRVTEGSDYNIVLDACKELFGRFGIHNSTVEIAAYGRGASTGGRSAASAPEGRGGSHYFHVADSSADAELFDLADEA